MVSKTNIVRLAELISAHAPSDGSFELRVPGIHAIKRSNADIELTHYVQRASLCVVAQGAKTAIIGGESYEYAAGQIAVFSIDVPVGARITRELCGTVPQSTDRSRCREDRRVGSEGV